MMRRNFIKTTVLGAASIGFYQFNVMEPRLDRFSNKKYCLQPAASIPVIAEVDVLVAGGVVQEGMHLLFLPQSLKQALGEDICGTYNYLFEGQENPES